jgi:uncharacterized C2H2 Zn-finger protein
VTFPKHFREAAIFCPHCDYAFTHDDMHDAEADLYELAPSEGQTDLTCPSCDQAFWVQGGYQPHYTTAFSEEELM